MNFNIVIPAIFDEGEFANRALVDIHGKPMIQYVYECAANAGADQVVIATGSARVGMAAEDFGATVCMVVDERLRGMARLSEVADKMGWGDDAVVVKLPGDAPLTPPPVIKQAASALVNDDNADCAVVYSSVSRAVAEQERAVSMVVDQAGYVMYMSHHALPHVYQNPETGIHYKRHLGIDACTAGLIRILNNMGSDNLDTVEGIEHIRMLYNGMRIRAEEASHIVGDRVVSEADVERVSKQIAPAK